MNTTTAPTVTSEAENVNANFTLQLDLAHIVSQGVNQQIAPVLNNLIEEFKAQYQKDVLKEAAKQNPNAFYINGATTANIVSGKLHEKFNEILETLGILKVSYLKGKSGSGKSFMGQQLADALGVPFYYMAVTAGITESSFFGRMLPNGEFKTVPFLEAYENGGVCMIDEADAGDNNAFLAVNNALSNKIASVTNRAEKPLAKMHEKFYCVAAANTWGSGVDGSFSGREIQDEAFLKRFEGAFFEVDYDTQLEKELLKDTSELLEACVKFRNNLERNHLNRTLATRDYANAQKLFLGGMSIEKIMYRYTARYTEFERSKALEGFDIN